MRKVILIVVLLMAGAFVAVAIRSGGSLGEQKDATGDWNTQIARQGAKAAYAEFKDTYADEPFAVQHSAAHAFGAALYQEEGLGGLAVCDPAFAYGCYHSLFGYAFAEAGSIAIVEELDAVCVDRYGETDTGCQHGIGHGLMEFLGPGQLSEALEACAMTTQPTPLYGCTSGVFMEFNNPLLFTDDGPRTQLRPISDDTLHSPCDRVASRFQESCYHEISLWWRHAYSADHAILGGLCADAVGGASSRRACYLGLGNLIASSAEYRADAVLEACATMPDSVGDVLCRVGAVTRLKGTGSDDAAAEQVCATLLEDDVSERVCS